MIGWPRNGGFGGVQAWILVAGGLEQAVVQAHGYPGFRAGLPFFGAGGFLGQSESHGLGIGARRRFKCSDRFFLTPDGDQGIESWWRGGMGAVQLDSCRVVVTDVAITSSRDDDLKASKWYPFCPGP